MFSGVKTNVQGTKMWFKNDMLHRVGGPAAIQTNGWEFWRQNNMLHRLDGPAVPHRNGYFLYGRLVNKRQHCYCVKKIQECIDFGIAKIRKNRTYNIQKIFETCDFIKIIDNTIVLAKFNSYTWK